MCRDRERARQGAGSRKMSEVHLYPWTLGITNSFKDCEFFSVIPQSSVKYY